MTLEVSKRCFNVAAIIGIVIASLALIDRLYAAYLIITFHLTEMITYLFIGLIIYSAILIMSIKGVTMFKKPLEEYDNVDFSKKVKGIKGYSVTYFVMAIYIIIGVVFTLGTTGGELDIYTWVFNAIMIIAFFAAGTLSSAAKKPIIKNINNFRAAKSAAATESIYWQNNNDNNDNNR